MVNFKNVWGKGTPEGDKWIANINDSNNKSENILFENDNMVINNYDNNERIVGSTITGYFKKVCKERPWKNAIEFLSNVIIDPKHPNKYTNKNNTTGFSRYSKTFCDT